MYARILLLLLVFLVSAGSVRSQAGLQSALNLMGYSIDVATAELGGDVFFQRYSDDVSIVFQESSQSRIESFGYYTSAGFGQWLVGGSLTGLPTSLTLSAIGEPFGFAFWGGGDLISDTWYSEQVLNHDGFDHLKIFSTSIAGATIPFSYILAWEDLPGGGDRDFQDMIIRVDGVQAFSGLGFPIATNVSMPTPPYPGSQTPSAVPEPSTFWLLGLGTLGGLSLKRFRLV